MKRSSLGCGPFWAPYFCNNGKMCSFSVGPTFHDTEDEREKKKERSMVNDIFKHTESKNITRKEVILELQAWFEVLKLDWHKVCALLCLFNFLFIIFIFYRNSFYHYFLLIFFIFIILIINIILGVYTR